MHCTTFWYFLKGDRSEVYKVDCSGEKLICVWKISGLQISLSPLQSNLATKIILFIWKSSSRVLYGVGENLTFLDNCCSKQNRRKQIEVNKLKPFNLF
jgi:hypothetical protein